jgi:hypothetical protein
MALVLGSRCVIPLELERNLVDGTSKVRDLYRRLGMESHVIRVPVDAFPERQIDEAIEHWPTLAPTVPAALRSVVEQAQATMKDIDETIGRLTTIET